MTTETNPFAVIGCAVDRSAGSHAALRTAAVLARRLQAKLLLLHVEPLEPGEGPFAPPGVVRRARPVEEQRWMQEAYELRGAPVELERGSGRIASTLLSLVRRRHVDLLVIGSGATRPMSLAVASVAGAVLVSAPCPVLVVATPPKADADSPKTHDLELAMPP